MVDFGFDTKFTRHELGALLVSWSRLAAGHAAFGEVVVNRL